MLEKGMRQKYGEVYFFVAYILVELKKDYKDRKYAPYIDILPKNPQHFPVFFKDEELAYLDGSPF